jgi:hypothetical protein
MAELENPIDQEATWEEINTIMVALDEADDEGVQAEVVWSALKAMKTDSNITIQQAVQQGLDEWVK